MFVDVCPRKWEFGLCQNCRVKGLGAAVGVCGPPQTGMLNPSQVAVKTIRDSQPLAIFIVRSLGAASMAGLTLCKAWRAQSVGRCPADI